MPIQITLSFCCFLTNWHKFSETLSRVNYNPDNYSVLELPETSHKPPEATPSVWFRWICAAEQGMVFKVIMRPNDSLLDSRVSTVKFNCIFNQLLWALCLILILGYPGAASRVGRKTFFAPFLPTRLTQCHAWSRGGSRGRVQGVRTPSPPWDDLRFSNTTGILQKTKNKKNKQTNKQKKLSGLLTLK